MGIQEVLLIVMCGTSIGSLLILRSISRRAADISEYCARIDNWTCDILRKVDPTNAYVSFFPVDAPTRSDN